MFYSAASALLRINQELVRAAEPPICRDAFYRLQEIYRAFYKAPARLQYDDSILLYLYYCAKAHNRIRRYDLLLRYMEVIHEQIDKREARFCELYGSYSQINTHFLQTEPLVA